ncbi:PRD domain-containing protein [Propioniciclava sp.]|uniref:PRD domain-containing protein n=1 Tax=Propioniciclava sp. TaxID=2038686 RepID=UPI002620CAD8|nr:PRD domain-containing protein [Propioniciclava sp.]
MELLRVFNNNVVLARDDRSGEEVILTGRGLGFQARPGQAVREDRVVRVFRAADGRDPDHLAELLAGIPPEYIQIVGAALADAGLERRAASTPTLVIALADHVAFAVRRIALGMHIDYPLAAEVAHLYADEYAQARELLAGVNARLDTPLPPGEAVALALHFVNAGFTTGDLSFTYTMTGVIQQMIDVIETSYGFTLDENSVSVGRFITHLRYLFVRIHAHRQLDEGRSTIGDAIRAVYPEALRCAERLAGIVELRLGAPLTEDEISYLTLHVARVATDEERGHP